MRYVLQPHVLRNALEGDLFAFQFLGSHEFDSQTLKDICRELEVPVTSTIKGLLDNLNLPISRKQFDDDLAFMILQHMTRRHWQTFRSSTLTITPPT